MKAGERYSYIEITIIDNNIPESEKQFVVTLLNPSGGAALGLGSNVTVIINHSDGAFGVFQFAEASLGVQAVESGEAEQSVGYSTTRLKVSHIIRKRVFGNFRPGMTQTGLLSYSV